MTTELKPWQRSWFWTAPGERKTFFYIALIHVSAFAGILLLPLPSPSILLGALALAVLGGFGTSLAYHRALTHHGLQLHPAVERLFIFFAVFNGSGTPLSWVANHRRHHAEADGEDDVSSPLHGGFWWAHLRWLWQIEQSPASKYCPDINKPSYAIWDQLQVPITAVSFFIGLIWGPVAWLWLGPVRLLFSLHAQCTVNSLCHLGSMDPKSPQKGTSINIWWLTPIHFFQGENWHANHHEDQSNPRLGRSFWQIDIVWYLILVLKKMGLVRRLRRSVVPLQPELSEVVSTS